MASFIREGDPTSQPINEQPVSSLTVRQLLTLLGLSAEAVACIDQLTDSSLNRMFNLSRTQLEAMPGVGPARAARVRAALELGRRSMYTERAERVPLRGPKDIAVLMAPKLQDLEHEEFHLLVLDAQHRLKRDVCITVGLLNSSLIHPREVFKAAIAESAAAVIAVHNHPSGDPTPSAEDRAVTSQLVAAGKLLDIPMHDHVIIGHGRYISFAEAGLL